jgi:hypothetical protein
VGSGQQGEEGQGGGGGGFWAAEDAEDAELRDRVRGRVLLEAGVAEAAWRCPGIGAICG